MSDLDQIKLQKAKDKKYMTVHQVIVYSFISWILDIPYVAIKLIVILICPWRLAIDELIYQEPRML